MAVDLDMFQMPPKEVLETTHTGALDLFSRPPDLFSRPPAGPPAGVPEAPVPGPRAPGEGPRRRPEEFEQHDLWQQFLDANYEGGRALIDHPDSAQRRRRRNMQEPRIRFNTGMHYGDFRRQVSREFEAWKQQQQEAPRAEPEPAAPRPAPRRAPRHPRAPRTQEQPEEPREPVHQVPKDFRTPVGGLVTVVEGLRVGDILQSRSGRRRKILEINGPTLRMQLVDINGVPLEGMPGMVEHPYGMGALRFGDNKVVEHAGPRVQIGQRVTNTNELRAGDVLQNNYLQDRLRARKILEVMANGDFKTQLVHTQTGDPIGDPDIFRQEFNQQIQERNYIRIADPTSAEQAQERERGRERIRERDRAEQRQREQQLEQERRDREQREQRQREQRQEEERLERLERGQERQHVSVGDTIAHPRQLRVGDKFSNNHLRDSGQYREVVEITPDGRVKTRIKDRHGLGVGDTTELTSAGLTQYGPYVRTIGPGHRVQNTSEVGPGSYLTMGDQTYRVVHRSDTSIEIQDVHEGRGVGRPRKLQQVDLAEHEYKVAPIPRQAESGTRVRSIHDLNEGMVIKAMHHRVPKWVRVEFASEDKVELQPLNSRTGENEGEIEELTAQDLGRWAYLTKMELPEVLQPPLQPPPGGFAEPGQGDLVSNLQPNRYDAVTFTLSGVDEDRLRELLGPVTEGQDPRHVIADLMGAGGVAKTLQSVRISVDVDYYDRSRFTISTAARGTLIQNMERTLYFEDGKPNRIYNAHFKLVDAAPKGTGLKAFSTQVAAASAAGFDHIDVTAAGEGPFRTGAYVGYYVWPRFGYNGPFPVYSFERMPASIKEKIRQVHPSAPSGLDFIHVMAAGKEAQDWWKEHGVAQSLSFDLSSDSRSTQALTMYVRAEAQERGVGADQFLQRAASLRGFSSSSAKKKKVEEPQQLTPEEEIRLSKVWEEIGDEMRAEVEKKEKHKKTASYLVDLALSNRPFRELLIKELGNK